MGLLEFQRALQFCVTFMGFYHPLLVGAGWRQLSRVLCPVPAPLALPVSISLGVRYTRLPFAALCSPEVPLSQRWAGWTEASSQPTFRGCHAWPQGCGLLGSVLPTAQDLFAHTQLLPAPSLSCAHLPSSHTTQVCCAFLSFVFSQLTSLSWFCFLARIPSH